MYLVGALPTIRFSWSVRWILCHTGSHLSFQFLFLAWLNSCLTKSYIPNWLGFFFRSFCFVLNDSSHFIYQVLEIKYFQTEPRLQQATFTEPFVILILFCFKSDSHCKVTRKSLNDHRQFVYLCTICLMEILANLYAICEILS